jgi:cytochrome c peroxidase
MSGTEHKRLYAFWGLLALAVITAPLSSPYAYAAMTVGRAQIAKLMDGYQRPADIPAPPDNPITPAKVALGKALFFDPRLSGSGVISCASCHNPSLGWQDGMTKGIGDHGTQLARRTPTILNGAWSAPLFWDGRAATLEDQAKIPMSAGAEMNKPHGEVVAQVRAIPGYRAAFAAAYPGQEIDIDTIAKAIATYERTVISGRSRFDEWLGGKEGAISASAKRGFVLFNTTAKCASCHSGWRFTDDGFHDIGLAGDDPGRGGIVPGIAILDHAFKTPTLRSVADRPPYMHDGSIRTLEEVVDHYDHGFINRPSLADQIKPLGLSAQDKADLVAFMRTLSSHDEAVVAPTLPQ